MLTSNGGGGTSVGRGIVDVGGGGTHGVRVKSHDSIHICGTPPLPTRDVS